MDRSTLKRLFWIVLTIPYLKPALLGVLEGTELLETAFDLWRMAAAGVVVLLYLYEMVRQRRRPSGVLLWLWMLLFKWRKDPVRLLTPDGEKEF